MQWTPSKTAYVAKTCLKKYNSKKDHDLKKNNRKPVYSAS